LGHELGDFHLVASGGDPHFTTERLPAMTARHRPLARLPLEVFEPFAAAFTAGSVFSDGCDGEGGAGVGGGGPVGTRSDPETPTRGGEHPTRSGEEEYDEGGSSGLDENDGPIVAEDDSYAAACLATTQQRKRRRRSREVDGNDRATPPALAMTIRQQICSRLVASAATASSSSSSSRLPQDGVLSHATNVPQHGDGSTTALAATPLALAPTAHVDDGDGMGGGGEFDAAVAVAAATDAPCHVEGAAATALASATTVATGTTSSTNSIRTVGQLLSTDVHDLMRKLDPLLTAGTYHVAGRCRERRIDRSAWITVS
jgi:hypothetical protein